MHDVVDAVHGALETVEVTDVTDEPAQARVVRAALLQPLAREFGWDVEQISSALAIRFVLFGSRLLDAFRHALA